MLTQILPLLHSQMPTTWVVSELLFMVVIFIPTLSFETEFHHLVWVGFGLKVIFSQSCPSSPPVSSGITDVLPATTLAAIGSRL